MTFKNFKKSGYHFIEKSLNVYFKTKIGVSIILLKYMKMNNYFKTK